MQDKSLPSPQWGEVRLIRLRRMWRKGEGMDVIFISEIECHCIIGVEAWERTARQRILVSLEVPYTWPSAAQADRIDDAVDYKAISKRIAQFVGDSQYQLIEALAEAVASLCLKEFHLPWIKVEVSKPGALRDAKTVGVRILRDAAPSRKPENP